VALYLLKAVQADKYFYFNFPLMYTIIFRPYIVYTIIASSLITIFCLYYEPTKCMVEWNYLQLQTANISLPYNYSLNYKT